MFKLNKKVKYGLIALKHMSTKPPESLTSAKDVCDTYGIPFDPTARTLQILTQKGILKAVQGAHGGYMIAKNLADVSLKDLNDIIMGPVEVADCLKEEISECACAQTCIMISPLLTLNEKIDNFMANISLQSLIQTETHPKEDSIRKKGYSHDTKTHLLRS